MLLGSWLQLGATCCLTAPVESKIQTNHGQVGSGSVVPSKASKTRRLNNLPCDADNQNPIKIDWRLELAFDLRLTCNSLFVFVKFARSLWAGREALCAPGCWPVKLRFLFLLTLFMQGMTRGEDPRSLEEGQQPLRQYQVSFPKISWMNVHIAK